MDRVIIHPLYTGNKTIEYNFALLHVNEEFNLGSHISPICLPDIPNQKTGKKPTNTYIYSGLRVETIVLLHITSYKSIP